ncbi:MAG: Asp-tRNA(Asn)/Glu-tRNA(Gln) amidotransferase subunit GatC [bacterium]
MITIEQIKKIAGLARIELTPAEEKHHAKTMSAVLGYMKILEEVDIGNIEPTSQVTGLKNIVREDVSRDCNYTKELIAQMPEVQYDKLKVPVVFDN